MLNNREWLVITAIHILVWVILHRIGRRKTDPFDPFYMVSGLYFMIFVYAPNVWIGWGQTSYQGVEVMSYMPQAMLVFNIGYMVYSITSYGVKIGKTSRIYHENIDYNNFLEKDSIKHYIVKYAWIVFSVSMILALIYYRLIGRSLVFMLTLGQGDELNQIRSGNGIYFLMQFVRSAIPGVLLLLAFAKKNRLLIYFCVYLLCAVCISTGSRNLAICVVLAIAVYSYMKKGKRPTLPTILIAITILYLFVGTMGIFRTAIKTGGAIDLSLVDEEGLFGAFMFNVEIFYPFFTLVGYMQERLVSCHYGLGILNIVIQFIPRAIWHSKPATLGATAFEAMYGDSMGGAAYPNIGEFYYEFGIVGVIVLMALFGHLIRKMYIKVKNSSNKINILQYSIIFGYLIQFVCRGHFASWALDIVFMLGPVYLLKYLLKRKYIFYLQQKEQLSREGGA